MDHIQHSRGLNLLSALLAVVLILSPLAVLWVNPNLALLGIALLVFTCVFALVDPFRGAGWVGIFLAIAGYAAAAYMLTGSSTEIIVPVGVTALCLFITGLVSILTARRIKSSARQVANDLRLIEDLRTHDPKTGLVRLAYARQSLKTEISRSQRYKLDLCLILLEIANWKKVEEEMGMVEAEELKTELANIMTGATRDVDTCFLGSRMGIILPQTNPSGASVVADRLVNNSASKLKLDLYVGVAYFPDDAVAEDELIKAAEAALHIAVSSGRSVVFFNQIRQAIENQSEVQSQAAG